MTRMTLISFHLVGGAGAMAAGLVALYAVKGAKVHRRSGTVFVYAMLSMPLSGVLMLASGQTVSSANLFAGLLITYLVTTAATTVQVQSVRVQRINRAAMVAALTVGLVSVASATAIFVARDQRRRGLAIVLLIFGVVAVPAGVGDLRMVRAGGLSGTRRLRRHLWRMCLALFIATTSFFLGTGRRLPASLHLRALRAVPFVVLATLVYWLWRLRARPVGDRDYLLRRAMDSVTVSRET